MGKRAILGSNTYYLWHFNKLYLHVAASPSIKTRAQMAAGACKQKPPFFLILLFVPNSGFLKRQAVLSVASGKPDLFSSSILHTVPPKQNTILTVFSSIN